jgi:hypothetical protein
MIHVQNKSLKPSSSDVILESFKFLEQNRKEQQKQGEKQKEALQAIQRREQQLVEALDLRFKEDAMRRRVLEETRAKAALVALRKNSYSEHISDFKELFETFQQNKLQLQATPDKKHLFETSSSYGTRTVITPAHTEQDTPQKENTMDITAEDLCLALGIALSSDPQLSVERQKDGSSILTFTQTKGAKPIRAHINLDVLDD